MTPALRKAAVLSLVLVALTITGAVLLLNEPDRDYGTEPGEIGETSRPEEQAEKPSRKETAIPTSPASPGTETTNTPMDRSGHKKKPSAKPPPQTSETAAEASAETKSSSILLQLLDAGGGEPVGDEEFNLRLTGAAKTHNLLLRTDSEGFARAADLPEGEYPTLLRHPRYLPHRRILTLSPEELDGDPKVVKVFLEKGESLTGKVTDLRGKGIKGVSLSLIIGTRDGPQKKHATSGNDGAFTLDALVIGSWSLTAFHSAYRLGGPLTIEIPARENLTIQLVESTNVNIFVENPDGTPCKGATVSIRTSSNSGGVTLSAALPIPTVRTNAEGLAVIGNLPANPGALLSLSARDARYPVLVKSTTVDELESGNFVMRFVLSFSLGGVVLDPDGNTVANIRVALLGPRNQFLNTTANGTFQFNNVLKGKYWLQASDSSSGVSKRLRIDAEVDGLRELELILEPGEGTISGWVENAAGQPLGLIPLRLSADGLSIESVSAPSGEFSFDYLPKATYALRAGDAKRGRTQRSGLLPGTDDIRLVIDRPGSLRGIIEGEGPALGFTLRIQESPGADAKGLPSRSIKFSSPVPRFHLRDLPPGNYDLHVLQQGKVIGKLEQIIIRPGEETGPVGITGLE